MCKNPGYVRPSQNDKSLPIDNTNYRNYDSLSEVFRIAQGPAGINTNGNPVHDSVSSASEISLMGSRLVFLAFSELNSRL